MSSSIISRVRPSVETTNAMTQMPSRLHSVDEIHQSFGWSVRVPNRAISVIPAVKPSSSKRQVACASAPIAHAAGWIVRIRFDANATAPSANNHG